MRNEVFFIILYCVFMLLWRVKIVWGVFFRWDWNVKRWFLDVLDIIEASLTREMDGICKKIGTCKVCKVCKVGLIRWYSLCYFGGVDLCCLCSESSFWLIHRGLSELCNFAIAKLGIYLLILWTLQFKIAKWGSTSANSNKFALRSVCTHIVN